MPRPHQNPHNRPPQVLLPDGPDVEEFNLSYIHIRQQRGLELEPLDGREPEKTLRRASHILRNISAYGPIEQEPVWWIGVGTALGFSREKGFIKGDTDIDLRILLDGGDRDAAFRTLADLVATFVPNGFRLIRESYWRTIPMQVAFIDRESGNVVDFYFFHRQDGQSTYVNYNERGYREKPAHLVDNRRSLPWPGHPDIIVNVPHPVEEYNAWRFGPNWRIPKKNSELTAEDLQCIRPLPELIVLTYGTFDLLHFGHQRLLERAAALGDRLVVGVVSDALCAIKGKPIVQNESARQAAVAALPYVCETFVQVEMEQKEKDIDRFGASLIVVGDDWYQHPRFEKVRGYKGVEIAYLKRTKFISSTLLRRLRWLFGGT